MREVKRIRADSKKIAVVRTDRLGDMILTLPMCLALKRALPGSNITMIADSYTAPLLEKSPVIDNALFVDEYKGGIKEIFKRNDFDTVYFPRPRFNEAFAAYLAGVKNRVGTAFRIYSFLFNFKIYDHRKVSEYHEAEYNTRMVEFSLGIKAKSELVSPYVDPQLRVEMEDMVTKLGLDPGRKSIIIHPGSGGSARDYPVEKFAKTAEILSDRYNILITGSKEEKSSASIIKNACPKCFDLSGVLSLKELIALLSFCNALIANSTGVLHIAASLGLSVVGLYPNTMHISDKRWGPYIYNSIVLNPPKDDIRNFDNMKKIAEHDIVDAIEKLLSREDKMGDKID